MRGKTGQAFSIVGEAASGAAGDFLRSLSRRVFTPESTRAVSDVLLFLGAVWFLVNGPPVHRASCRKVRGRHTTGEVVPEPAPRRACRRSGSRSLEISYETLSHSGLRENDRVKSVG